jgi:hypothetical protein
MTTVPASRATVVHGIDLLRSGLLLLGLIVHRYRPAKVQSRRVASRPRGKVEARREGTGFGDLCRLARCAGSLKAGAIGAAIASRSRVFWGVLRVEFCEPQRARARAGQ